MKNSPWAYCSHRPYHYYSRYQIARQVFMDMLLFVVGLLVSYCLYCLYIFHCVHCSYWCTQSSYWDYSSFAISIVTLAVRFKQSYSPNPTLSRRTCTWSERIYPTTTVTPCRLKPSPQIADKGIVPYQLQRSVTYQELPTNRVSVPSYPDFYCPSDMRIAFICPQSPPYTLKSIAKQWA